jgi:hypothetical protein
LIFKRDNFNGSFPIKYFNIFDDHIFFDLLILLIRFDCFILILAFFQNNELFD